MLGTMLRAGMRTCIDIIIMIMINIEHAYAQLQPRVTASTPLPASQPEAAPEFTDRYACAALKR